jgi:hypothetical protein
VLTLGGAIPGAIGFGRAAGCFGVARNPSMSVAARVGVCTVITLACWIGVVAMLGRLAILSR